MEEYIQNASSRIQSFIASSIISYILFGIIFILVINAILVDIWIFSSPTNKSNNNLALQQVSAICPQSCVAKFSEFVNTGQKNITTIPEQVQNTTPNSTPSLAITPTPSPTPTPTPIATSFPTPTAILREYFIPLGQGSGSYTNWTVVPGIGAKINITTYGKIEKVYFEVTVRVPAGSQIVNVRLYNASNMQHIANSDVTLTSNTSTLLSSPSISPTDTKDENLYQVQLKTQLGSTTYIDQARLRILAR